MKVYAIINKETNIVSNVINVEDENFIFLDSEKEYFALANRAVQIGMTYDESTGKFPEAGDQGEVLDLRDEIDLMIKNSTNLISQNTHLTADELQVHRDYINQLRQISYGTSYVIMKSQFDAVGPAPEFPPVPEPIRVITQDVFRGTLNLAEKVIWDNPETGTTQQSAAINTIKIDFPFYGVDSMTEELAFLQQVGLLTSQRITEITTELS